MRELKSPPFINPFVMRSLPQVATVINGSVTVCGQTFTFTGEPYPDGTQVEVDVRRIFYCESLEELEEKKQAQQRQHKEYRLLKAQAEAKRIVEAKAFNASLNVPSKWRPDYKRVLSGLTENSMGNGQYKNTVYHIQLLEPLNEGRLHRGKFDLLCTTDSGKFSELLSNSQDEYPAKVTCKKCLEIAKRWNNVNR